MEREPGLIDQDRPEEKELAFSTVIMPVMAAHVTNKYQPGKTKE